MHIDANIVSPLHQKYADILFHLAAGVVKLYQAQLPPYPTHE
jgi:hypothetical protein